MVVVQKPEKLRKMFHKLANARAVNALAAELAWKVHWTFHLSKLTLRVAFARTMLRESRSSRKTRATLIKALAQGSVVMLYLKRAARRIKAAEHHATQSLICISMSLKPLFTVLNQLLNRRIHRIQAFDQSFSHVEGAVLPNPLNFSKVAINVRLNQIAFSSACLLYTSDAADE